MVSEGDVTLFMAAFLSEEGFLATWAVLLLVFAGAIIRDTASYYFGVWLNSKPSRINTWLARISSPIDNHLRNRLFHTIFIAKFTYGIHHAVLIRAGALGVPFGKFLREDIFSICVWTIIVGGAGYFAGASFSLIKHYMRFIEVALFAGLALFILIGHFISSYSKKEL